MTNAIPISTRKVAKVGNSRATGSNGHKTTFEKLLHPSQQTTSRKDQSQTERASQQYAKSSLQADEGLSTSSSPILLEPVHSFTDRTQVDEAARSVTQKWKMGQE